MNDEKNTPAIHLALRFHTNFYHSYRGDTPDELGFGKDIRIVTKILDDLDRLNAEGIPVQGTWDIENYYSLEQLIPKFAPQLLERLQRRVAAGQDTVAPMSYNNGIVSACTEEEFHRVAKWTLTNPAKSGIADLFSTWEPVLRPQECLYTPSFLRHYPKHGIDAISLYYSAHPFNGFSNFMPRLTLEEQYNPLRVVADGIEGEMIMAPAYNNGDVADHWLSLAGWLKRMRRDQMRTLRKNGFKGNGDLLLLLDMDADDDFWFGLDIPVLTKCFPAFGGLYRLVKSVSQLPWLRFTTTGEYLKDHPPVGEIHLNQDTADGSFDGLSSWAEKHTNTELWTVLQQARFLSRYATFLAPGDDGVLAALDQGLTARLLAMSTTHFGLTSPIMNKRRLETAREWCHAALQAGQDAFQRAAAQAPMDLIMPAAIEEGCTGATGVLIRFAAPANTPPALELLDSDNNRIATSFRMEPLWTTQETTAEMAFLCTTASTSLRFAPQSSAASTPEPAADLRLAANEIANHSVSVRIAPNGAVELGYMGTPIAHKGLPAASLRYDGKVLRTSQFRFSGARRIAPEVAQLSVEGTIPLDDTRACRWTHRYLVASGLPHIYVDVAVEYPETEHKGYNASIAKRLGDTWDNRWEEVMPWEFAFDADTDAPLTIWKHNFFGDTTRYRLDYGAFSANSELDSFNNHLTNGWVAVNGAEHGILLAQSRLWDNSFAFCPMRLRRDHGKQTLYLNPFGTYYGKQLHYHTAHSGLGKMLALGMADHLRSYAPSYNGQTTRFSLLLAPYQGDAPPVQTQHDAMLFATPPVAPAPNPK